MGVEEVKWPCLLRIGMMISPHTSSLSGCMRPLDLHILFRYQESYEQKLDPFSNFSKQEKQRKYGQLSVFEKVDLFIHVTRLV